MLTKESGDEATAAYISSSILASNIAEFNKSVCLSNRDSELSRADVPYFSKNFLDIVVWVAFMLYF